MDSFVPGNARPEDWARYWRKKAEKYRAIADRLKNPRCSFRYMAAVYDRIADRVEGRHALPERKAPEVT